MTSRGCSSGSIGTSVGTRDRKAPFYRRYNPCRNVFQRAMDTDGYNCPKLSGGKGLHPSRAEGFPDEKGCSLDKVENCGFGAEDGTQGP